MKKLNLGDYVRAPVRLLRRKLWQGRHEWYKPPWRESPIEGVFVGVRTYANGTCSGGYDRENPVEFHGDEWIKVALICKDSRQRPIPVLYDECVKIRQRENHEI